MAVTAEPTAPPVSPVPPPRQEDWRDAIVDYRPPAGPDGCWASDPPDPAEENPAADRA